MYNYIGTANGKHELYFSKGEPAGFLTRTGDYSPMTYDFVNDARIHKSGPAYTMLPTSKRSRTGLRCSPLENPGGMYLSTSVYVY